MSAKKGFETNVYDDQERDIGIESGPLSEQLFSSEELDKTEDDPVESNEKVISESDLDSGLCLLESFSKVNLSDPTPTAQEQGPLIVLPQDKRQDIPLAELFKQDHDGDTHLHIKAVQGCQQSVAILIRLCPDRAWLDVQNDHGHTPLHLATMSGHAVVTRMLVRAGASIEVRDFAGETPLHKAVSVRSLECIQALLTPVSDAASPKLPKVVDQRNYKGQCCVHLAAQAGHVDTLQALVNFGADINARESLGGWTALHIAARRGDANLIHHIQRAGAGCVRDYAGRTARAYVAGRDARVLALLPGDDGDDSDDELCPCSYDSDGETFFEILRQTANPINVA